MFGKSRARPGRPGSVRAVRPAVRNARAACNTRPELYSSQLTSMGVTLSPPGYIKNTRTACDIQTTHKNIIGSKDRNAFLGGTILRKSQT